jgi:hypothetical protein
MLQAMVNTLYEFWQFVFPSRLEQTLRKIEVLLEDRPFVKVHGATFEEDIEGTFFLVVCVDRKLGRLHYFNPYSHANLSIDWNDFSSLTVDPVQNFGLKTNPELNRLIWKTYKDDSPYKRGERRRRLGYDWKGNPIYIERGLHVYKGTDENHVRWGSVACFEVAALSVDRGGEYYEAFPYYAGYGTYGITIDIGEWEPDPRFIDYEQQNRNALRAEYDAYMASPPFEEGQMIESPHFGYLIFIGYTDSTRSAMRVYPGNVIEGITTLMTFKVSDRQPLIET